MHPVSAECATEPRQLPHHSAAASRATSWCKYLPAVARGDCSPELCHGSRLASEIGRHIERLGPPPRAKPQPAASPARIDGRRACPQFRPSARRNRGNSLIIPPPPPAHPLGASIPPP